MRIRKNLKITHQVSSESSYSATTPLQAYICQLNQSPWDVSPSSPSFQLQEHDSFLGNGMCEDINGPLKSVARKCLENGRLVEEDEEEVKLEEDSVNYCSKTDENGNWICGLEAKEGETFCEFHLRSYIALAPHVVETVAKKITTKAGKNNGSKKAKKEVDPNPYQSFNYYSGFGPNWGKKRGARELSKRNEVVATPCSSNGTEDLSIFEDEDEDEKCEVNGTKRVRKRIKARSLKSLM